MLVSLAIAGCGAKTGLGAIEREGRGDAGSMRSDAGPLDPPLGRTLSMSWSHACAIDSGEVVCWGDNSLGAVGEGVSTPAPPTRVPGLRGVREVATGQLVSCALDFGGAVWCWGTVVGSAGPRRIDALPRAERIVAGSSTVCVITAERTVA